MSLLKSSFILKVTGKEQWLKTQQIREDKALIFIKCLLYTRCSKHYSHWTPTWHIPIWHTGKLKPEENGNLSNGIQQLCGRAGIWTKGFLNYVENINKGEKTTVRPVCKYLDDHLLSFFLSFFFLVSYCFINYTLKCMS